MRLLLVLLALVAVPASAAAAPPTVYESATPSPENMDYDAANRTFRAHAGWLDDRLVHYYKFRMYTPDTFPSHVPIDEAPDIPVMPLYLVSTDGTWAGLLPEQGPIVRYAHGDEGNTSDFVRVVLVDAPPGYAPGTWTSWEDVEASGAPLLETDAFVNAPLVPVGSRLAAPGGGFAPIEGVEAWYDGEEVQLFYFETTSREFADAFNPRTRTGEAGDAGSGFEIVVTPFVREGVVTWIPIWHLNQYSAGVAGEGGGPDGAGQRNVIDLDRLETGYSPLWQVMWVSRLPPGYSASQASDDAQITAANGFTVLATPMFVNCPNVGPHGGGATNARKADAFEPRARVPEGGSATLRGALVMDGGKTVTARSGGNDVATATTGMMGAYSIEVDADDLPAGESEVEVVDPDGNVAATFAVARVAGPATDGGPMEDDAGTPPAPVALVLALVAVAALGLRRVRSGAR